MSLVAKEILHKKGSLVVFIQQYVSMEWVIVWSNTEEFFALILSNQWNNGTYITLTLYNGAALIAYWFPASPGSGISRKYISDEPHS